jgi:DNA-binding response OmpR family regulator
MPDRVLVVEDERSVGDAVVYALEREGFEAELVGDGNAAVNRFEAQAPNVVVLDLMLPGRSGWELLSEFRRRAEVPVILLTARAEEADRVAGLEMGADDYVVKPFSMRELIARVRAVLRRSRAEAGETGPTVLLAAGVAVDLDRHEASVDGKPVELSPREFALLAYLVRHAGRTRTREQILHAVWGQDEFIDRRTVDVHVRWLRTKIEQDPARPRRVMTVRGVGYKFSDEE